MHTNFSALSNGEAEGGFLPNAKPGQPPNEEQVRLRRPTNGEVAQSVGGAVSRGGGKMAEQRAVRKGSGDAESERRDHCTQDMFGKKRDQAGISIINKSSKLAAEKYLIYWYLRICAVV
ncbi:hypothetical protein chiPu_0013627 [Chiloscyllium punctatum]|uniref:Uncharacterized protein n=1 Tax=Chiloscyllium punctatum TaxID=137246 RepID=A0A401SXV5_CHIPU|nr:hypothetical protein [Chiloscyllium punctatum]